MRIRSLAVATAMLATTLAAPLAANASMSQCSLSQMCVWGNNDFEWLLARQAHGQGVIDVFNDGLEENNQADSWYNRSNAYRGCLYNGIGTDPLLTMGTLQYDGNVSFLDSDRTSSMRTNGPC